MFRLLAPRSVAGRHRAAVSALAAGSAIALGLMVGGGAEAKTPTPGSIELVSVATNAAPAAANAFQSATSRDGRFVAFVSKSQLTDLPTFGFQQVYVRDLVAEVTTMVSVNSAGTAGGKGVSERPSLSDDGRFVAFDSDAPGMHPLVTSPMPAPQVYVRDVTGASTDLISVRFDEAAGGSQQSIWPSISADGSTVAFQSRAGDLISATANIPFEVFVADRSAHPKPTVVSLADGSATELADNTAISPRISADGSTVAFVSTAGNLGANNMKMQIFTRVLATKKTTLVSFAAGSAHSQAADSSSADVSLSADGTRVAYGSVASNITADTRGVSGGAVFVYDSVTEKNTLVSVDRANTVWADGIAATPSISADGRIVAFVSSGSTLVSTAVESSPTARNQVYVRDLAQKMTQMVSLTQVGRVGGSFDSDEPSLSADGRFVSFTSLAPRLTAVDTNGQVVQVYEAAVPAAAPPTTPAPTTSPATAAPATPTSTSAVTTGSTPGTTTQAGHLASTGRAGVWPLGLAAILAIALGGVVAMRGGRRLKSR